MSLCMATRYAARHNQILNEELFQSRQSHISLSRLRRLRMVNAKLPNMQDMTVNHEVSHFIKPPRT